jgi:RNA binding exosome subunit
LEVTYLVHATEDMQKVQKAVSEFLGVAAEPEVERLEGHFGNQITKARLHLTGEEAARAFERAVEKMPGGVKKEVTSQIGSFLDEHSSLYLRLDKQELASGRVALAAGDSVRMKVKPRMFMVRGGGAEFFSHLIGGD